MPDLYLCPAVEVERRPLPEGGEGIVWGPRGWDQPGQQLLAARQVRDHPGGWFLAYFADPLVDASGCYRFTLPLSPTQNAPTALRNFVAANLGLNIPGGWKIRQCVRYVTRSFGWLPPDGVIVLGDQRLGPEDDA